jgi:hypothetical protein
MKQHPLDLLASRWHDGWCEEYRKQGWLSNPDPRGRELLVSFDKLPDSAKELERAGMRRVLAELPDLERRTEDLETARKRFDRHTDEEDQRLEFREKELEARAKQLGAWADKLSAEELEAQEYDRKQFQRETAEEEPDLEGVATDFAVKGGATGKLLADALGDLYVEDLTRRRFRYHPPGPGSADVYRAIRDAGLLFALAIASRAPDTPERETAIERIEEAVMWANAAVARARIDPPT